MYRLIAIGFILQILSFSLNASPSNQPASLDTIIAEGRYIMGDRDSKAEARDFALMEAKRKVLEQAGTFLKAHDVTQNYMLTEQEIQTFSVGFIQTEILEEKTEPAGEAFAVTVKIRGVINSQEVQQLLEEIRQEESAQSEFSQLQENYAQLVQQMDSLKNVVSTQTDDRPSTTRPPSGTTVGLFERRRITTRQEGLQELAKIEALMRLIAESKKRQPDIRIAKKLTDELMQKHPNFSFLTGYLGIAYFKNDNLLLAIKNLENAVGNTRTRRTAKIQRAVPEEIKNRHRNALALFHYYLAQSYGQTKRKNLALQHLREAQKLDPQNKRYHTEAYKYR